MRPHGGANGARHRARGCLVRRGSGVLGTSPSLGNETGRLRVLKILFPWFRRVTWFVGEVRDGLGHRSVSGPRPPSAVWAHTRNVFRVVRRLGSGQASAQMLVRFLPQCGERTRSLSRGSLGDGGGLQVQRVGEPADAVLHGHFGRLHRLQLPGPHARRS